MALETKQSSPSVTDAALRLPAEFPSIPAEVLERFPSMREWYEEVQRFTQQNANALNEFAQATLDVTDIAGILIVDPNTSSIYIKNGRGAGAYRDADTPFYVDKAGQFSLGAKLYWNALESSLTIDGTIYADAGEIGGFELGADYIRDAANSFGLASTVTGGDDVRFWAGDTFANRATAPFRVTEAGVVTATSGTIGGFTLGTDYIRDAANSFGLAATVTGGNDVRFWAGDTFANRATADFRVYEDGQIFASAGTIGGFTITATNLYAGTGADYAEMNPDGEIGFIVGDFPTGAYGQLYGLTGFPRLLLCGAGGASRATIASAALGGFMILLDSTPVTTINCDGATGNVAATSFSGSGAALTALNATNLASGTVNNARLPAAISVTSLTASGEIRGATARFGGFNAIADTPVVGWIDLTDAAGNARRLAVV